MKVLIGAAAATLLLTAAAFAQPTTTTTTTTAAQLPPPGPIPPSHCPAVPDAPPIPDGATARQAAFDIAVIAHNAWVANVNTILLCRGGEIRDLEAARNARQEEHTAIRTAALARNDALTAAQAAMTARHPARH